MIEEAKREVARIAAMDHETLTEAYHELIGRKITFGDGFMRRRLQQKAQLDRLGGFTPTEIETLARLARSDKAANPAQSRPLTPIRGTTYTRVYKGKTICVKAVGYGKYEYEGKLYGSLTACVKVITGTHFSGKKFFNLEGKK